MAAAAKKTGSTKTAGETMLAILNKGKGTSATTEELATAAGLSVKDAYSRLWWLSKKEGVLKSTGHGKTRTWALTVKGRKSVNPPADA